MAILDALKSFSIIIHFSGIICVPQCVVGTSEIYLYHTLEFLPLLNASYSVNSDQNNYG